MNIEQAIDDLRQGLFEIDCPTMELRQRKDNGEVCHGSGYIKQGSDGRLTYKLYVAFAINSGPMRQLETFTKVRPGKLFEDEDYYDLTATAIDGTTWTASRFFPSFDSDVDGKTKISYGPLDTLRADLPNNNRNHYQRLHFFEELDLPLHLMSKTERNGSKFYTLDRCEFIVGDLNFEVRKRDGSGDTIMEVTSKTPIAESFHLRAQEALQFLTGKTVMWRARVEVTPEAYFLVLTSPFRKAPKTTLKQPLASGTLEFRQHAWRLFGLFLTYVIGQPHGTQWNPVAYHLHNARESTANSIDAGAVGVSVALEAVASLAATTPADNVLARIESFKKHMHDYLSDHAEFFDFTGRLDGALGSWSKKSPNDTLYALAERGFIRKDYIKSWGDLRHRHVHPTLADLQPPSAATYQVVLNNTYRVEVLLYQLIFHLVGYKGPYTDYGAEGFPISNYPLAVA